MRNRHIAHAQLHIREEYNPKGEEWRLLGPIDRILCSRLDQKISRNEFFALNVPDGDAIQ